MSRIRIATRRSPLALWQAEHVAARLREGNPAAEVELVPMSTQGDKMLDAPLAKVGGKGLFVKELENALLEGRADIAVHSMKDVPVEFPEGLHLPVIMRREDPRDAFVSGGHASLEALPEGARVGTSSLRRKCQVLAARPDLALLDLRGGVGTRLRKLDEGEYDAIILASAGLKRLEIPERIRDFIATDTMLPAIGQGAMGIECRQGDTDVNTAIGPLADPDTSVCVRAERAMNQRLGGGCQVPIAGHATLGGGRVHMRGLVASVDGARILRAEGESDAGEAEALGLGLAERLIEQGADAILAEVYAAG